MKHLKIAALLAMTTTAFADSALPPTPPQDQGLPYTRSARAMALAKIAGSIALCSGSRYAYVYGRKVRLDDKSWKAEAVLQNGKLLVPMAFGRVLANDKFVPPAAPKYLEERWVYEWPRAKFKTQNALNMDGAAYFNLASAATARGLSVSLHPRGLMVIGKAPFQWPNEAALDAIVTLFDTPEKFADPDIATRYVPTLMRQGKWTQHVKATPQQLAILNGPETKWPTAPKANYDFKGFNKSLLGSKVPPPGVYPRVLFSPEDVPVFAERIRSQKLSQKSLIEMEYLFKKSWWDASTSDGQIFQKLIKGDIADLDWDLKPDTSPTSYPQQFKDEKPGIFNTHIAYIPETLSTMALFCLLTNDNEHARQAAAAIANYYRLREPILDEVNAISDSEFGGTYTRPDGTAITMAGNGSTTHYRTVAGVVAHNLGFALDFGGKWMTPQEKDDMRRIIAKTTYGRRSYGQDGPVRFRDVNWVTWDLPAFITVTAIEGLEGFDREAYESGAETARAFCDWGIDDAGVVYESNGKTPGGLQWQTLSMVALARRGENLFGHTHFRRLLTGQIQMTSPNGNVVVNSGTQYVPFSREHLSLQFVDEMKAFFPNDLRSDYLLSRVDSAPPDEYTRQWSLKGFDAATYKASMDKMIRLRLSSPTYPGFVRGVLYDTDYAPTPRADLKLPLDFSAPTHGVFSSRSDDTPNAAWINMMVRPDHYLGAGHHHADAGMFHFSALGVDWFTESPFSQSYAGKYHNQVLVDGISEAEPTATVANGYQAAGKYLGANFGAHGGFAGADLTNSYSYRWQTQPGQIWPDDTPTAGWEVEPSPDILKIFAGTARYKMRPWWPNSNFINYIPTSRAPFNPMQYVYRATGLVRGAHPYGIVMDDLKKDDTAHLYQWTAMLNGGVWQAKAANLPAGQTVLGFRGPDPDPKKDATKPLIEPQAGEPLLLVCALGMADAAQVTTESGPPDRNGVAQFYDRFSISYRGTDAHFKVLLIPFRNGETLPQISFNGGKAIVSWPDAQDQIAFTSGLDSRSRASVARAGATILESR